MFILESYAQHYRDRELSFLGEGGMRWRLVRWCCDFTVLRHNKKLRNDSHDYHARQQGRRGKCAAACHARGIDSICMNWRRE